MVVHYLPDEKQRLVELLADASQPLSVMDKKFKELVPPARYSAATMELVGIARAFLQSSEACGLVGCLFISDLLKKAGCVEAKGAFFDIVVEIEKAIRKDMFLIEQIKYASKDAKESKKATVAGQAEEYRLHTAVKVFSFRALGNDVSTEEKPASVVSLSQEALDTALDGWEKDAIKLKEPLADLTHYWSSERDRSSCALLYSNAAIVGNAEETGTAMVARTAGAKLPAMAVSMGELQCLLTGPQPYFVLDAKASSEDSRAVTALLETAKSAVLTKPERTTLIKALTAADVASLGITAEAACQIGAQNPEVCATVLLKLPSSTAVTFVDKLIASDIPEENVDSILLHASKVMSKENLDAYVSKNVNQFKGKKSMSAAEQESVKRFSTVLHQLVTKASSENKALSFPTQAKDDLGEIFNACESPEVASLWSGYF